MPAGKGAVEALVLSGGLRSCWIEDALDLANVLVLSVVLVGEEEDWEGGVFALVLAVGGSMVCW